MAGDSLLSIKGKVQWSTGDYSSVINDTKRMVMNSNAAALGEIRSGSKKREGQYRENLAQVDKMEKESGQRLVASKKSIADKVSSQVLKSRTPIPPEARKTDAAKEEGKRIDGVIRAAETGYSKLKKILKTRGVEGMTGKTAAEDYQKFGQMEQGEREVVKDAARENLDDIKESIKLKQQEYDLSDKRTKKSTEYLRQLEDLKEERKEQEKDIKKLAKIDRKSTAQEKRHRDEMKKTASLRHRIFGDYRQMKQHELQMEREILQMNRDVAEEIGRVKQEVGEGLRSAFTYATVAVTAFWYKLQPVVETFQEFEKQLMNAQSIWQESNDVLFELSDQVVQFGQNFGINMGQATEGLYQYASAGVEAADAMAMLNDTLTLSMAVQGDHNTLAKLTTQTIMGFGMEFSDATEVTDKFAHAINKSLIEWDDLASSVKFALPFFTSTGQSLDQLLGALAVLTNRALEAGIAGRGLRQALAEFTQHAEDNSAAFNKMGVEILDVNGNMRELTDIAAQFQDKMGEGVNDMDIMMALMDDLNIRGATAFVHLVQNADEFQQQVDDLSNSAGAAASMAEVQQKSLANQIQLVKNALEAPFLMSEDMGEGQEYLNSFAQQLHMMVQSFESLIIVENEGKKELTEFGTFIKTFVIVAMKELQEVMGLVVGLVKSFGDQSEGAAAMLHMFTVPIKIVLKLLTALGPEMMTTLLIYGKMNQILPLNAMHMYNNIQMRMLEIEMQAASIEGLTAEAAANEATNGVKMQSTVVGEKYIGMMKAQVGAMMMMKLAMFSMIYLTQKYGKDSALAAPLIGALAGAFMGLAFAINATYGAIASPATAGVSFGYSIAAGAAAGALFNTLMAQMMSAGADIQTPQFGEVQEFATGGRVPMYANGGRTGNGHFPVMVEGGETIIPKTQNMLGGGITLNMGDVYANDAEDFAERVAEALPLALRRQNDIGGI